MKPKYFLYLVFLAAIWGLSFSFIKIATPEFGSFALAFMRIILAALFLIIVSILMGQGRILLKIILQKDKRWHWLISGLVGQLFPFILYAKAELTISASAASILNATTPIWAAIVAFFWLKKKFSIIQITGIVISFVGVSILVSSSSLHTNSDFAKSNLLGSAAILLATFFYGYGSNYLKKYLNDIAPLQVATASTIYAAIAGLPLAIYFWPDTSISSEAWNATLLLGLLCTGFAFIIFFELISKVDATSAVSVTFLIPVFGVFWGVSYLNESLTTTMLVSMIVILVGVIMSNLPQKKSPQ
ncbi:MAG: DMT family transporter [Arenicella sp.]